MSNYTPNPPPPATSVVAETIHDTNYQTKAGRAHRGNGQCKCGEARFSQMGTGYRGIYDQ